MLWNSKLVGILQQIWACLIIAQVLQALRMEIACGAGVDPFEVSLPLLKYPRGKPVADFYAEATRRIKALPGVEAAAFTSILQNGVQIALIK